MNKNIILYVQGGVIVLLVAAMILQLFGVIPSVKRDNFLSKDAAAAKMIDYIKNNLVSSGTALELKSSEENTSGIYKVNFTVMGQEETVFITKDAKYLFLQSLDMQPPAPKGIGKTEKPAVDLFVMSFCPYGNEAEGLMVPVMNLLKDKIDVGLHYVIYSNYQTGYPQYCLDKENKLCSMHGIQEIHQDIRELCVQKYQKDKLWAFVSAINSQATANDVDSKWEAIAQGLGLNVNQIKTCQTQEGKDLLTQEAALSQQQYPAQDPSKHQGKEQIKIAGSPTLVINGTIYDGSRSADAYKEGICSAFTQTPSECSQTLENPSAGDTTNSGSCQ